MKNKFILISIAVIILAVAGFFVYKQITLPVQPPSTQPTNFNLIFKYGVGAKNELNTFDQTYTKDLIMDPPVTIKFKLTDSELAGIYQKINDLKLFDKTVEPAEGEIVQRRIPCDSYYLKVQNDSVQKELSWDNCQGEISDKLQQFTSYITSIIEARDEYKKLPEGKGGYK